MQPEVYRYEFASEVEMEEVEASMVLALLAAESLHGETEVRLKASHLIDAEQRVCVVNAGTDVGSTLNRLFLGFIRREFGFDAFNVKRATSSSAG